MTLERKKPLQQGGKGLKRTELARGTSQLAPGGPIARRTPLQARKPAEGTPEPTAPRRARVRAKRAEPRKRDAPRWTGQDWDDAFPLLWKRCRDRCDHCGKPLDGQVERHHRARRRDGGDRYANLLMLRPECHAWVHAHPAEARAAGWIVHSTADPATVPVLLWGRQRALLDDAGGWAEARLARRPPGPRVTRRGTRLAPGT